MGSDRLRKIGPTALILFYLAIAFEVVIMITPFTVYFYSLYAPILNRLEANVWTSWLTAFFLPHITYTEDPLLLALVYSGPILLGIGLAIFFVCAFQVYSAKLFRRGVVTGGLYRYIRHPQYLGLAIAGLGLLLYWPRFIILVLYVSMLFVYYFLARNEEGRMLGRYGEGYRRYVDRIPMFLPGNPGGRLFRKLTGGIETRGLALTLLYVITLVAGVGAGFLLREYTERRVPILYNDTEGLAVVSLTPIGTEQMGRLITIARNSQEVASRLADLHREGRTLVAYILPQEYMMQHLLADLGEHEAHHGKGGQGGFWAALKHLGQMYLLTPLAQLRDGAASAEKRIIFTEALTATGNNVSPRRALSVGVLRYPRFFADIDAALGEVILTMETPRRHSWGTIPVPAF
ncbi:MAG: methyltransferase family protein [Candidatus Methylomirabilales bacterium]